jgi:PadR family transcriptional regulator, regulatory protein AphA
LEKAGFGLPFLRFRHIFVGVSWMGSCDAYLLDIYLQNMPRMKKTDGGTTQHALLGLLSLGPMSGYDIRTLISWSIGHFWSESYGQIYPGLKRLAAQGLVEKKTERKKGRPDRYVYSLTREGRARLEEWLALPPVVVVHRNELLLKLFFGGQVGVGVNRAHVSAFAASEEDALKTYEAVGKRLRREQKDDPSLPFWLMTLSFGRHRSEAMLHWARETLREMDKMERSGVRGRKEKSDARR